MTTLLDPSLTGHAKRVTHLRGWLLGHEFYTASEAMDFALGYHTGVRKDGRTPEFAHQVYIVSYLRTLLPHLLHGQETLAVGFLHDICEDYDVSITEIDSLFGGRIAQAVNAMSKVYQGVKRPAEQVLAAQAADPIASICKPADRINNQQTMPGVFSPEKMLAYIDETRTQIIPMMKRARHEFASQYDAYQNARTVLFAQIELVEATLAGLVGPATETEHR